MHFILILGTSEVWLEGKREGRSLLKNLVSLYLELNLLYILTDNIDEGEELTEEVSVGPPVVVLEVLWEVVQQQPLLLPLLHVLESNNNV